MWRRQKRTERIVFVDFDGVLIPADDPPGPDEVLSRSRVAILGDILEDTGARVVVTSSLRTTVEEMRRLLGAAGLAHAEERVIGVTPSLPLAARGDEIGAWIKARGRMPDSLCILDDDDDMTAYRRYLIWIDRFTGLTVEDAARAKAMLARSVQPSRVARVRPIQGT